MRSCECTFQHEVVFIYVLMSISEYVFVYRTCVCAVAAVSVTSSRQLIDIEDEYEIL